MKVTCPCCNSDFPLEAGFSDADGKRLAALMVEFEPALGRAVVAYLRLFKPAKTSLRVSRAISIVSELLDLVRAGTVCRDERNGLRRPAPISVWIAGIEQMLAQPGIETPLDGHNYLRKVVFALADQVDAKAERTREDTRRPQGTARTGVSPPRAPEAPLAAQLAWLRSQLDYGAIKADDYERLVAAARAGEQPE
jgi:hypothetical protein